MSTPNGDLKPFDRIATAVACTVASAWFFGACVLIVLIWAPSYFFFPNVDTWQLVINTLTTIVTFLLVALLQNTQHRADQALQKKLNAIVDALAQSADPTMSPDVEELRQASGLEKREGT